MGEVVAGLGFAAHAKPLVYVPNQRANTVQVIDPSSYTVIATTGTLLHSIRVRPGPHGLLVWPQPGRYSLGHTGNMR